MKIVTSRSARGLSLSAYVGYTIQNWVIAESSLDPRNHILRDLTRICITQSLPLLYLRRELLPHNPERNHHSTHFVPFWITEYSFDRARVTK